MKTLMLMCAALILTAGCDGTRGSKVRSRSQTTAPAYEATWQGTFTVTYSTTPFPGLSPIESGAVTVSLTDGKYTSTGNTNHVPTAGSGIYTVSGNKFTFESNEIYSADFDAGLILAGEYIYTLSPDQLVLRKYTPTGTYEYILAKKP
jgi:heat shock protein HslJ